MTARWGLALFDAVLAMASTAFLLGLFGLVVYSTVKVARGKDWS
jgi:hypothetical protein